MTSAAPEAATFQPTNTSTLQAPPQSAQQENAAPVVTRDTAQPSPGSLGDLPSFHTPKTPNEPTAILAAWTALEALSPMTHRRPEDLAGGDLRCIVDLSHAQLPWISGESSRPKRQP